jgi:hypothetical protein
MTEEEYIRRAEFQTYCRAVNGSLTRIEDGLNELRTHLSADMELETTRRRDDAKDALVMSRCDLEKAIKGTMSRSYAIIITVLTGLMLASVGALLGHVLTHH